MSDEYALTAQDRRDYFDDGIKALKDDRADPFYTAERFGELTRVVIPADEAIAAIIDAAPLPDDAPVVARKGKKKARRGYEKLLRKSYTIGARRDTGLLLGDDDLAEKSRINERRQRMREERKARELDKAEQAAARNERSIRASLFTYAQLRDEEPLPPLVEGIMPQASIGTVVGPSGVGKSAMVHSLSAAIVRGKPWMGHAVNGGSVLICVAEGGSGIGPRFEALSAGFHKGKPLDGLTVLKRPIDMTDTDGEVAELRAIVAELDPALVVWDTLIRYAGGADENSASQMSVVLGNMEWVCRAGTRTTGLAVHHSGHDARRARGSSAIYANVDFELTLSGEPEALRLEVTKQKDGRSGPIGEFRLASSGHNGAVIFEGIAPGQGKPSGDQDARIEEALAHFVRSFGSTGTTRPEFRDTLMESMSSGRSTVQRYIESLIKDHRLAAEKVGKSWYLSLPKPPTTL